MRPESELMKPQAVIETAGVLPAFAEQILDFERLQWRYPAAKENAIRREFSLSATHYYQIPNALADTEAGYRLDPVLIKRLRARRPRRTRPADG